MPAEFQENKGDSDRIYIPHAVEIVHSVYKCVFYESLAISPNVYTNRVHVYKDGSFAYILDMGDAAKKNRTLLQNTLRRWEEESDGEITYWGTPLLKSGVTKYGFTEDAVPW